MDPAQTNSFLDRFLAVADTGFGLIQGDVSAVLNILIALSITLAGIQWILAGEAPLAPFFRKVLFVGLFAFLVNNWNHLATVINQSGAMLGLKAGGGSMSIADFHNPGRVAQIGVDLFGRTAALATGMNIITDFVSLVTIYLAAFFVMLGFFVLALQLFVALIAFKLGSLAAFVALPWGVFNGTAWVAERPLGWVAGCAIRLFVLALVASVSITFVDTLPGAFALDMGGALQILFFGLTMLGAFVVCAKSGERSGAGPAAPVRRRRSPHRRRGDLCNSLRRSYRDPLHRKSHDRRPSRYWRATPDMGRGAKRGPRRRRGIDCADQLRGHEPEAPITHAASKIRTGKPSMKFPFRAPARSFAPPSPDTPYQRGRQEWDARMGAAVLSARAWRNIALGSLALAAALGFSLTAVALQKRTFVHVVEVDPEGQVMSVRVADGRWSPSQAEIAAQLGRFIRMVRALPTDGVVLRENWVEAYRFLTPQAAAQLTQIARSDDPFLSLGRNARTVQVRSILARSDRSWEVSWIERNTNETGATEPQTYTGVFTVTTRPPANADDIAINPLGILISDFSWSRER